MKTKASQSGSPQARHILRKSLLALCATGGMSATGIAVPLTAHAAVKAPQVTNYRSGPLSVNQQIWGKVPYFVSQKTTYFGVWYMQQLLKDYGYITKWDGRSLFMPSIPIVYPGAATSVNGFVQDSPGTLFYGGTTYVDASSAFQGLGASASSSSLQVGGLISSSSPQVKSTENSLPGQTAAVWEGSHLWQTAPIVVYKHTSYFGIWYLQQFLSQHGITSNWNGTSLSIPELPRLISGGSIVLGGTTGTAGASNPSSPTTATTIATPLISWQGRTYIPVTVLKQLGVTASVNNVTHAVNLVTGPTTIHVSGLLSDGSGLATPGDIAFQDATGNLTVLTAGTSGGFAGEVPTSGSTVIGVRTDALGWIGQVIPVTPENASAMNVKAEQDMTTLSGKIDFQSAKPYQVVQVSVRNIITHAHYYADVQADGTFQVTVPVGSYEVFALSTDSDAIFLLQPFLATSGGVKVTVTAPALPAGREVSTAHADIVTSDSSVSPAELVSVANMFESIYQDTVNSIGVTPTDKMEIQLFGTGASYEKHYVDEGYSKSEAQSIAEQSVASEEGDNAINILMPTFDTVDGLNILSHEFTHALIAKLSSQIPSWANEGAAWTDGVKAEEDHSPSTLLQTGIQWDEWVDIVAHQQKGTLIALGQTDTLNGDYNVEAQDYFAVQQLIKKFGWDKFLQYVKVIDTDKFAFQDTFGESFSTFSQQVTSVLAKDAANTDKGVAVRLATQPNGPQQIYFINPDGTRCLVSGLEPSQSYDFTLNPDGSVSAPLGLTVTSTGQISDAIQGDWFIGSGADGDGTRQEFDIVDEFGLPFIDQVLLYSQDGSIEHVYPATAIPNGIELVSISAVK